MDYPKDDCSFKYDNIVHSSEIERSVTNNFDNSVCFEYCKGGNSGPKEQGRRPFFRIHYRKHSRQLVNALKKWVDQLTLTSYEYKEGRLSKDEPDKIEPEYVEYIEYMKLHLNKAYPNLIPSPSEIDLERKKICGQIENVTVSLTSTVPYNPSYERIIIDKIKASCPNLKRSQDATLTENDIYLDTYIFGIIFDKVTRHDAAITLEIKPKYKSDIKQLFYEGGTIIAQAEEVVMINLKLTLEELISNESVKRRIKDYEELKSKLLNDPQIEKLRVFAREMRTQIYGGAILGGYPACDLCDPDIPFHFDQQPANVTTDLSNRDK
jgi:hypothetical protein